MRPTQIQFTLFGHWQLTLDGIPIKFATDHARALLAYLVVESRQHDRAALATLLWPEQPETAARQNLRQTLLYLKQALRDFPQVTNLLEITAKTLYVHSESIQVDLRQFRQLRTACADHAHPSLLACAECNARLQQAADLYAGEFLKSLFIKNSAPFEEWALFLREHFHRQALEVFHTLTLYSLDKGDYAQMQRYATRQLALEPWREEAHRQVMMALALTGQDTAALMHYATCRRILHEEVGAPPSPETTALYEQIRQGKFPNKPIGNAPSSERDHQAETRPSLATPPLPPPTTPLLGRADEMTQIATLLAQPTCRWLTLVGPPGVGKTRLAQAVAIQQQATFGDGVYFVDLATSSDPTMVFVAIAAVLGVREQDSQALTEILRLNLHAKNTLLLLDNFEQVEAAAPALAQLVADCQSLNVLITSRWPLRVAEEQLFTVQPLGLPDQAQVADVPALAQSGAVQLFVQRATAAKPDFQLTATNAGAVAALCIHLDGLPLAIELAAARSRLFSPATLLVRLQQRLPLLVSREPHTPLRHQTLRAALDWSYDLLTAEERILFQRLAVFVGGFTLDAAERVMAGEQTMASTEEIVRPFSSAVIDGVESLFDKNLLRLQATLPPRYTTTEDEPRFTMLETLREYALSRLASEQDMHGHRDNAQQRHAHFFLALAEEVAPKLFAAEQVLWLNRLEVEHDNLRVAQDWFMQHDNATLAFRLAVALRYFWRVRGYYSEGCLRLQRALTLPSGAMPTVARAQALNAAGYLEWVRGERAQAQALLTEALHVAQQITDPPTMAFALRYLGVIADADGDPIAAQTLLEESLTLYRQVDGKNDIALSLLYLGDVAMAQQQQAQARHLYEECAALLRVLRNNITLPYALRRLGYLALWRQAHAEARLLSRESLHINLALGEQQGTAAALVALAAIAVERQALTTGVQLLGAADAVLTTLHTQLLPFDGAQQTQLLARASSQLDGVAFAQAWAQGKAMAFADVAQFVDQLENAAEPTSVATLEQPPATPHHAPVPQHGPAPSSQSPNSPSFLPAALTPFVGRKRELSEILARLRMPDVRLLTLVGTGGMGKTRLALETARTIVALAEATTGSANDAKPDNTYAAVQKPTFADGIFFVPLAALNAAAITPAIAAAIGLVFQTGDLQQALRQTLQHKQLLLILDNFEHLLPAGTPTDEPNAAINLVLDLLQHAPGLQLIVTSRERLNLLGEHLYQVQGLGLEQPATLADATTSAAVQLFVQSARRVQPHFQVTEANWQLLLHICALVQGMPLGIEMAAVWTNQLALDEIAREIEQSIDFLAFEWHNAPVRQRSMRAVFDWSWQLLNATEQQVLGQLAVFRGGFTREAAEAITGASLRVLTSLVNKSLLQRAPHPPETHRPGQGRYELHELLRQFAQEQTKSVPEEWVRVAALHSQFYLAFIADRERRFLYADTQAAVSEIQTELSNIRQAWYWAVQQRAHDTLEQCAYSLWQFFLFTGLSAAGVELFRLAANALQAHDASVIFVSEDEASRHDRLAIASKLRSLEANMLIAQGHYTEAAAIAQQALRLAEASTSDKHNKHSSEGLALAHLIHGQTLCYRWQPMAARVACAQALVPIRYDEPDMISTKLAHNIASLAYLFLSSIALRLDEYAESRRCLTRSLQICQHLDNRLGELDCRINLANIARIVCDHSTARQGYEDAMQIAHALHYRWSEATIQLELSDVVRSQGEYTLALDLLERALTILHELNDRRRSAITHTYLSRLYTTLGDYTQAQSWLDQAWQLADELRVPEIEEHVAFTTAVLAHARQQHTQALQAATQSWQLTQAGGDRFNQAKNLVLIGHAQAGLNQLTAAANAYQQSMQIYHAIAIPPLAVEAQAGLVRIALAQGDLAQVETLTTSIVRVLAEHPRAGLHEPFLIYLTCYQGLTAIQHPQAATVLQAGYDLLQTYADHIADRALRRSFLENVAVHRELIATYEQHVLIKSSAF